MSDDDVRSSYKFARIPEWILLHPQLDAVDIRVYAVLDRFDGRACFPSLTRVAERIGKSEDTVRRSLKRLQAVMAVVIVARATEDGRQTSNRYYLAGDAPLPPRPSTDATLPLAEVPPPGVAPVLPDPEKKDPEQEDPTLAQPAAERGKLQGFEAFWKTYPRKTGRGAAERAWPKAVRQVSIDELMIALARRMQWWLRAGTPDDKIPHASTWLNGKRWLDEMEALPAAAAATQVKREQLHTDRQRSEADDLIAAGDWERAWKIIVDKATASGDRDFARLAGYAVEGQPHDYVGMFGLDLARYSEVVVMFNRVVAAAAQRLPELPAMTGEPDALQP